MSLGQQQTGSSSGWSTTLFIIGAGVVGGIALVVALSEADKCPRMQSDYNRALRSTGLEHKLADHYLDTAQRAGCRWARRWPFVVAEGAR